MLVLLQRAMNFIFHEFIGKLVVIYIDDVVVKSGDFAKHLADLRKVLECTRKHGLKMNPNKCAFGVSAGQFLGFMVHVTPQCYGCIKHVHSMSIIMYSKASMIIIYLGTWHPLQKCV